ncbi:sphingosine 1-phosphate receptor 5-like [Centruroides vittatus]|uniref:sphingosine 1-phosphate receptor 5-like n=1 Tax=Centruroides sculpturatus TaxID=218467 RepID=UPI000C6E59FE|nr:sphingosine 1-phosphate receptor 5-like [Centruroides sculpturatus]
MFLWNCTIALNLDLENRDHQRLFVLISVAIATMAFLLNLIHFLAIIQQSLLKQAKNIIIMSFCICGQLSSVVVAWYVYRITAAENSEILSDYNICYFVPSGFLLVTLFTSTSLITLQVLQLHFEISCKSKTEQRCRAIILAMVVMAWFEGVVVSVIPIVGWNNWQGYCTIPHIWSNAYSMTLCLLYYFHLSIIIALLFNVICANCKKRNSVLPECNEIATITDQPLVIPFVTSQAVKLKNVLASFTLYVFGTLPIISYMSYIVLGEKTHQCHMLILSTNYEVGSILLIVLSAAISPLFYIFTEDDLAAATAQFIHIFFCPCTKKKEISRVCG